MKKINKIFTMLIIFLIVLITGSCEEYFEYSPYAANVKSEYKYTFDKNLEMLNESDTAQKNVVKIAVISDSHYNYHELNEAIVNINSRNDIDFVIANGDISDHGYIKEFELFHDQMESLTVPYFTVIGNHDYRSNGEDIYKTMYGDYNKTIIFNNMLFVLFDDVFWESNKIPDFTWLENKLAESDNYDRTFVLAHIPPYSHQFTDESENLYCDLMRRYNVDLSIHGHVHKFSYDDYYHDGMNYTTIGTIIDKEYGIITMYDDRVVVESINY
ncbi:MAG: metallophosphoesterase [Bacteroidetes bacterium]|nr:metallophosphoesterase [Bacteroidota bacterium]